MINATMLFAAAAAVGVNATAQPERPSIQTNEPSISYQIDDDLRENSWRLAPELKPDILIIDLVEGQSAEVCFITDVEEFCRTVSIGDQYDVDIFYDGVAHFNRILGRKLVPAAVFSDAYIAQNTGKINIVIPEVYELVNVAIALTEHAREDRWLVIKETEYYARLMEYFADHLDHPFVLALNAQIEASRFRYAPLKMNGYAFEYDADGEIQRSSIYDRTGFASSRDNALVPFLGEMRTFSRDTNFRAFYAQERITYEEQINFYRDVVNLDAMKEWLGSQFPEVDPYDTVKIVFSPLVGGSQSVTWFVQGDFGELQPHVNFPYHRIEDVSPESEVLYRGNIVFTELNHGYINPTAENYRAEVDAAITDLAFWAEQSTVDGYGSPMAMLNEYMNWGLVALYYLDHADEPNHEALLTRLDGFMDERGRGFLRFPEFAAFLVDAYEKRAEGETMADLYPAVIDWFARREASRTD